MIKRSWGELEEYIDVQIKNGEFSLLTNVSGIALYCIGK